MIDLIHGDCLEVMKDIPDNSIDLILTDPPYGTTACKWDSVIPFDPMWAEIKRVRKDRAAVVLFGSEPFSSALRMSNIKEYKYDWVWQKQKPTNFMQIKKRPGKKCELLSVFYKKQCAYFPIMVNHEGRKIVVYGSQSNVGSLVSSGKIKTAPYIDNGYRYPTELLNFNRDKFNDVVHPTQKPVELLEYLIKTYTKEGETVLDFTMGSGSTGVACKNLGRAFIGIELDKEYFEIAKNRING